MKVDYRQAALEEADRAMLDYVAKVTLAPATAVSADIDRLRDVGFGDKAILEINQITGFFAGDYASRSTYLLFMQTIDSTLRLRRGKITPLKTQHESGPAPSAFIPAVQPLVRKYEKQVKGMAFVGFTETLFGIPTTAHILGGAVMGASPEEGVIDKNNRVFGYQNMLICDGAMISANPGVNPSLTITAISERAMAKIKEKMRDKS